MVTVCFTIFNINASQFFDVVFICFLWHVVPVDAMKVYGADELRLHSFLVFARDASEWPLSLFANFAPGEGSLYPLPKSLGRLQSRSGRFGKERNPLSLSGIELP